MIKISKNGRNISVSTPYHPAFPQAARDMGGKWSSPVWVFDGRDEKRVRDFCLDLWGTDGTICDLVTLRVVASTSVFKSKTREKQIYLCGRLIAKVFGRDDKRARLGDGVVISTGKMFGSGSSRSPYVEWSDGCVFELRDVPAEIARQEQLNNPELIEIIDSPVCPNVGPYFVSKEVQELIDQRAMMIAKIAEIDAFLMSNLQQKKDVPTFEVANELQDKD